MGVMTAFRHKTSPRSFDGVYPEPLVLRPEGTGPKDGGRGRRAQIRLPRFSPTGTGRDGESGAAGGVRLCEGCCWV